MAPGSGQPCLDHACAHDLSCTAAGVCQPLASAGEPCASSGCQVGLECDASMKCAPPAPRPWILTVGFWSTTYACD